METDLNLDSSSIPSHTSPAISQPSIISTGTQDSQLVMLTIPIATKPNRDNFLSWRSQVTPLLHAYGLFRFLESSSPSVW